jgi:C-terminal processing protease CtpA/Prc
MFRAKKLVLPVAFSLLAGAAFAGGAECHKDKASETAHKASKCKVSGEDCKKAMAEAKTRGWMGIELDEAEHLTVTKVVGDSPAQAAGFQTGDVLLALNGVTLNEANKDKVKAIRKDLKPGDKVTYTIQRGDANERISVTLGTMPDSVYQAWTQEHMKEHPEVAAR